MPTTEIKKLILVTILYVATAFLTSLASAGESRLALIASYLLWGSVVLLWIPNRRWVLLSCCVPVLGSAVLVVYFFTTDIRLFLKYSSAISTAYLIRTLAFLALLLLTLLISIIRLRSAASPKLWTAEG
jgi:hypothetical protein